MPDVEIRSKIDCKNSSTSSWFLDSFLQAVFTYALFYLVKTFYDIISPNFRTEWVPNGIFSLWRSSFCVWAWRRSSFTPFGWWSLLCTIILAATRVIVVTVFKKRDVLPGHEDGADSTIEKELYTLYCADNVWLKIGFFFQLFLETSIKHKDLLQFFSYSFDQWMASV